MPLLLILIVSLLTHFFRFGYPRAVVFDETYLGNFITNYWHGTYYFDVHPPFAKLLFALWGYTTNVNTLSIDWSNIGLTLPETATILRLIPLFFGIILPLIIYGICRAFGTSKFSATVISLLVVFENSLLVQSRFLLPDILMITIGFLGILSYLYSLETKRHKYLLFFLSILFSAITVSIKWTGLSFVAIILFMEIKEILKNNADWRKIFSYTSKTISIFIIPIIFLYITVFAIHLHFLPNSGPGDLFMSLEFQKTLKGNLYENNHEINKNNFLKNFIDLNKSMYTATQSLTNYHPYSSPWYTWPIMLKPIFYWESSADLKSDSKSYIYYFGNPFIYFLSSGTIIILIGYIFFIKYYKQIFTQNKKQIDFLYFILIGYTLNFLPFLFIKRVMFLYHYQTALVFSILSIAYILELFINFKRKTIGLWILFFAICAFIYWSPLTYGTDISNKQLSNRIWINSWR